jgi:asparagine synthase (glutamine-hydrolysing)
VPGIFGLVRKPGNHDHSREHEYRHVVDAMASAMQYETFYACRRYESAPIGIWAGWVGPADAADTRGAVSSRFARVTLLAAGEPRLAEAAPAPSAAVPEPMRIIGAYNQMPDAFPRCLAGQYAGVLIDERRESGILFNDRIGMERLFVYEDDRTFCFASEAKAILAAIPRARAFDLQGVAEFMTCGSTIGEASLYRGIRVLPAASAVVFGRRLPVTPKTYFSRAEWQGLDAMPQPDFVAALQEALTAAVRRDTTAPPAAALSLTGGLDSRMILASIDAPAGALPGYTFGSMYRDTYDVKIGRRVAAACRQPHHVLRLDRSFVANIDRHIEQAVFVSDGCLGLSGAAELFVNRLARSVAPVRVTGNYGGELLRAFRAFKSTAPAGGFLSPALGGRIGPAVEAFNHSLDTDPLSFTLFHQAPAGYGRYAIERSQVTVRSPFLDDRVIAVLYRRPHGAGSGGDLSARLIGDRRPDLLAIPTDRGLLGSGGAAVRATRRLFREAVFKAEYLTGHGAPRWMAALTAHMPGQLLERAFAGRHKFVHPRIWWRTELGAFTRDVLAAGGGDLAGGLFDPAQVRRMVESDTRGATNHSDELDKIMTLTMAARLLFRPQPVAARTPVARASESMS